MKTEAIADFLYREVERNLREFEGNPETELPFSREELLRFVRRPELDNREDFSVYDMDDDIAYGRELYLYGLRRVPEPEDMERMVTMRHHFEKTGRVRQPAWRSAFREQMMQGIIHSEEARVKSLHIRHNPYDRRNAVRRLDTEGKDDRT
ncbi:MAG: hypothetical protein IKP10_01570 [Clostridia bacterium]|nr:hypothetical protein [Clostridia bacterium]